MVSVVRFFNKNLSATSANSLMVAVKVSYGLCDQGLK